MAAPMSLHLLIKPKYLTSILSVVCGRTVKFQGVLPVTKSIDFKIPPPIPFTASFAKKAGKGQPAVVVEEEPIEVNKNPEDLVKYCVGSNYFKEGSDVELKPDEEYPDWLWELHTGPPKTLEELDPETPQYWQKLRKINMKRNNRLAKLKKF